MKLYFFRLRFEKPIKVAKLSTLFGIRVSYVTMHDYKTLTSKVQVWTWLGKLVMRAITVTVNVPISLIDCV